MRLWKEGNTTEKSIIKRSTSSIFLYSVGSLQCLFRMNDNGFYLFFPFFFFFNVSLILYSNFAMARAGLGGQSERAICTLSAWVLE